MFKEHIILRIPGPTPIPPNVERAMARPMVGHRSGEFSKEFAATAARLKLVFQTEQDVFVLAGSGTAGLEAAVANTVSPGDTVLICTSGNFGDRFTKIAKAYGANPLVIEAEWGTTINPDDVRTMLGAHPEIKAVFATHCETSTGVLNPIREIADVVRPTDAILIVDAVSSLGGADLPMDAWGLDIVVTGSQKALMLPTGLCFMAVSEKAWQRVEQNANPRFYFDLRAYKKQLAANTTPYTPAVSLIYGLQEVMNMIEEEGVQNMFARHKTMQRMVRAAIKALGLRLYTEDAISSPTVTSVYPVEGTFDPEQLRKVLRNEFNIAIAGGQAHMKGKIFRIGHMGYATPVDMLQVIAALEIALVQVGASIELGAGVRAAQEAYLQKQEVTAHV